MNASEPTLTPFASETELSAGRAWTFQYCSTWGYIMTAPPRSAVPANSRWQEQVLVPSGPKLVSTLMDYAYSHEICEKGFPKGEHYTMPERPISTRSTGSATSGWPGQAGVRRWAV